MANEAKGMIDWAGLTREMERLLHLRTYPVAYKRLEKVEELEKIPRVRRFDRSFALRNQYCQIPTLVRRGGLTIGVTRGGLWERCARIHGLAATTDEEIEREVADFGIRWFDGEEEARKQMAEYPLVPPGEALVLAPLASGKFDPDVILIYGTPAQLMLLMNGLQVKDYERFQFFFIGEGACADGLAQCYVSGKPALAVPCFGERRYGGVEEDELVLALPPGMMGKAVEGLHKLWESGLRYPIPSPAQPDIAPRGLSRER
jgi:uncharacterized protein (DUF169 family)